MIDSAFVLTRTMGIAIVLSLPATPRMADQQRVANGQWGGQHVGMEVSDSGAHLEFDCARGRIAEPLMLNQSGVFDVKGTYSVERPGPRREDDSNVRAVRYAGRVEGKSMTLAMQAEGVSDPIGRYTLEHGKTPLVKKCQ
jgi:hypothetical protein